MDACFGNKYEVGALPVYPTISGLMVFIWEKRKPSRQKTKGKAGKLACVKASVVRKSLGQEWPCGFESHLPFIKTIAYGTRNVVGKG